MKDDFPALVDSDLLLLLVPPLLLLALLLALGLLAAAAAVACIEWNTVVTPAPSPECTEAAEACFDAALVVVVEAVACGAGGSLVKARYLALDEFRPCMRALNSSREITPSPFRSDSARQSSTSSGEPNASSSAS
jgi:hypothetical protein